MPKINKKLMILLNLQRHREKYSFIRANEKAEKVGDTNTATITSNTTNTDSSTNNTTTITTKC
ncbi:hypothetical protein CLOBY_23520 [Clostridium saccharobutylicum]|uniref:hypothetical protein n=1 Tax=Clostridium saccharobutylicum TaxID=169679 RepID=UPI000983E17B|nr:hypothetical protein [Clostridium saccharobutylicum]AQS10209.1 hypothetical protein CLOBY_23520 [Clostridium saccharobutylicum]MBC2436477.1 hypothetical protein [Clostridium saccharobutylicum]NSB87606.1 hypothetical protein [Clostridium saccharobutylicum]NYC31139.1 hypothetical protein [Clostridium saccharobutylicum]OOM17712.1 hypothetical protein CLSAB_14030 [Clostridium saccharobutylicum]